MKKFEAAFKGLKTALKHKAVRVQICLGVLAVIGGFVIHLEETEWLAFIISIGMVITAEVMNTAMEYLCNYVNSEYDEKIGQIKDLSSAAVLVSAVMAFVIMLVCLVRRI